MSRHALTLPLRLASSAAKPSPNQWICRRCLATATEAQAQGVPDTLLQQSTQTAPSSEPQSTNTYGANYDPSLPASQRSYRLSKTDFHLKKPLPQKIPIQYLQHSTSDLLHHHEKEQRERAPGPHKEIVGVVVSAGKMDKTVKVRVPGQRWEARVGKVCFLEFPLFCWLGSFRDRCDTIRRD